MTNTRGVGDSGVAGTHGLASNVTGLTLYPLSGTVGRLLVDAEGKVTRVPTRTLAKSRLPQQAGAGGSAPGRGCDPPSRVRAGLRHAVSLVKLLTARGGLCVISGGWFLYNYNTPFRGVQITNLAEVRARGFLGG